MNKTVKEPLITKAYDAFRKHKSVHKNGVNLVPTETYIEDQYKQILIGRARAQSGLQGNKHKSSTEIGTGIDETLNESTSLPIIPGSAGESGIHSMGPISEENLVKVQGINPKVSGYLSNQAGI